MCFVLSKCHSDAKNIFVKISKKYFLFLIWRSIINCIVIEHCVLLMITHIFICKKYQKTALSIH